VISIGWFLFQARKKRKLKEIQNASSKPSATEGLPTIEEQKELLEPERSLLKELLGESFLEPKKQNESQPHVFSAEEEHESIEQLAEKVRRKKKKKEEKLKPIQSETQSIKEEPEEEFSVKAWLFEDEMGPQKAIILSEILKRREY